MSTVCAPYAPKSRTVYVNVSHHVSSLVQMYEALGSSVELFLVLELVPGGSLKEALANDGQQKHVLFVFSM